jgi:hypothetical protein
MPRDYNAIIGRMTREDMQAMLAQLLPQMNIEDVVGAINENLDTNDRDEILASVNGSE